MEGVSRALDYGRMATARSHFTGKNHVSGIRTFGRLFGYYWAAFSPHIFTGRVGGLVTVDAPTLAGKAVFFETCLGYDFASPRREHYLNLPVKKEAK